MLRTPAAARAARLSAERLLRKLQKEANVSLYFVERTLPGITPEALREAAQSAKRTAIEFSARGTPVTYLRSTFVPEGERCYCLFESESEAIVREVQEVAQVPFDRILPAAQIVAEDLA